MLIYRESNGQDPGTHAQINVHDVAVRLVDVCALLLWYKLFPEIRKHNEGLWLCAAKTVPQLSHFSQQEVEIII